MKTEVASLEATHTELSHKNIFFSDFLVHRILHGMLRHAFAVFFLVLPLLPFMVKFALFMGFITRVIKNYWMAFTMRQMELCSRQINL